MGRCPPPPPSHRAEALPGHTVQRVMNVSNKSTCSVPTMRGREGERQREAVCPQVTSSSSPPRQQRSDTLGNGSMTPEAHVPSGTASVRVSDLCTSNLLADWGQLVQGVSPRRPGHLRPPPCSGKPPALLTGAGVPAPSAFRESPEAGDGDRTASSRRREAPGRLPPPCAARPSGGEQAATPPGRRGT